MDDPARRAHGVTINAFGIVAVVVGVAATLLFGEASGRGKGEEILPLGLALVTGGAAALIALIGWVRGARRGLERISVLCGFAVAIVSVALVVFGGPVI